MATTAEKTVTVNNAMGIHMRPADMLSRAAGQFQCSVVIEKDGQLTDCKSIMSILGLGAQKGQMLRIRADGDDAQQAVDLLAELFAQGFEEADSEMTFRENKP